MTLFVLFISCNKKQDVFLSCEQQHKKAKNDFNNNKFIYFDYLLTDNQLDREIYSRLLKDYNIILDTLIPDGCIPTSEYDLNNENCYKTMMNNNLHAKFGHQFFDSLRLKSTVKK